MVTIVSNKGDSRQQEGKIGIRRNQKELGGLGFEKEVFKGDFKSASVELKFQFIRKLIPFVREAVNGKKFKTVNTWIWQVIVIGISEGNIGIFLKVFLPYFKECLRTVSIFNGVHEKEFILNYEFFKWQNLGAYKERVGMSSGGYLMDDGNRFFLESNQSFQIGRLSGTINVNAVKEVGMDKGKVQAAKGFFGQEIF